MQTGEAATLIGISAAHTRYLIRNGKLKARRVRTRNNQTGIEYDISMVEAIRVRDQNTSGRGRPRRDMAKRNPNLFIGDRNAHTKKSSGKASTEKS